MAKQQTHTFALDDMDKHHRLAFATGAGLATWGSYGYTPARTKAMAAGAALSTVSMYRGYQAAKKRNPNLTFLPQSRSEAKNDLKYSFSRASWGRTPEIRAAKKAAWDKKHR